MDIDDFLEEAQFLADMAYLNQLAGELVWRWASKTESEIVKSGWDEIDVYGDEPIFGAMIFDRLIQDRQENYPDAR